MSVCAFIHKKLISMKFGVLMEVDESCMTVCSMTRSKVKARGPLKLEIWPFCWQLTTDS